MQWVIIWAKGKEISTENSEMSFIGRSPGTVAAFLFIVLIMLYTLRGSISARLLVS